MSALVEVLAEAPAGEQPLLLAVRGGVLVRQCGEMLADELIKGPRDGEGVGERDRDG
ncbi:hypothetical protein [Glaciibacter sp. 2TAF33]|uniref:hypothetical protein n=1 Tax=Glaciibacter sp. 2TAF33 TaxID=3233015 RepID=UPI003F939381